MSHAGENNPFLGVPTQEWDGKRERRQHEPVYRMLHEQGETLRRLEQMHLAQAATMENMLRGFPKDEDGKHDPEGHRKAHEAWIKEAEERTEFWKKLKFHLAAWSVPGLVMAGMVAGWHEFVAIIKGAVGK